MHFSLGLGLSLICETVHIGCGSLEPLEHNGKYLPIVHVNLQRIIFIYYNYFIFYKLLFI